MFPSERYMTDPLFHNVVDTMLGLLRQGQMTGTEIREAATLAAQIHEMQTVSPLLSSLPAVHRPKPSTEPKKLTVVDDGDTNHRSPQQYLFHLADIGRRKREEGR